MLFALSLAQLTGSTLPKAYYLPMYRKSVKESIGIPRKLQMGPSCNNERCALKGNFGDTHNIQMKFYHL